MKLQIYYLFVCIFILSCFLLFVGCSPPLESTNEVPVSIEISDSEYAPMNDYMERLQAAFSESPRMTRSQKPVDELFPAKEIPADELSWFLESYDAVTVDAIKGIRFDNDDILIVFFYNSEVSDETVLEHIAINIGMYGRQLIPPPGVYNYSGRQTVGDGFGVIACSFGGHMDGIISDVACEAREIDDQTAR